MASFPAKLAQSATHELATYNGLLEHQSPLKERIGAYWEFVGRPDLDGGDHSVPWSAAFISYMVKLGGAGKLFPYSTQHSVYFYRTINDKLTGRKTAFWGYEPDELSIAPGDIIGMNRAGTDPIPYDWASHHRDYKSHADIVVAVDQGGVHAIGGNVGKKPGQVGRKTFAQQNGRLTNGAQDVFVVIRSVLP